MRAALRRIMSCRLGSSTATTTAAPTTRTTTRTTTTATAAAATTTAEPAGWKWRESAVTLGQPLDCSGYNAPLEDEQPEYSNEQEHNKLQDEDFRETFYKVLQNAQPEQAMNALLDPRCAELVASLPQSTFVEALHLLSPVYFVEPYRDMHRPLHPTTVQAKGYRSLESIFEGFAEKLATVVQLREHAGHVLGLAEYTHLLDCARAAGDAAMADVVWDNMKTDEVRPDVQCYNHFMEVKVWHVAYTGKEKYHLRMTPFAYRKRRFAQPNNGWQGYGTAGRSVRKEVLGILKEMSEEGHQGDETTFVNVLLACSRVGHVKGIRNVLKTAWNIDLDALLAEPDDSKIPPVRAYDASSPLRPTQRLLFALAHVLGTNNDMSSALRTVDFVANAYNLTISERVWRELFERTFVLSRPRFGPDAKRNAKGKVSYDFLVFMYETMTAAPYHVRPTIEIYHMLAKTAWDRDRLSAFSRYMRAAYDILLDTRRQRNKARSVVQGYLDALKSHPHQTRVILTSRGLTSALNTYDLLRLRAAQQTTIMERLARLLIINHRWTGRDNPVWERVLLPQAIDEWQDFLPKSFVYPLRTGLVQFRGDTRWGQAFLNSHGRVPTRRVSLDPSPVSTKKGGLEDDFIWEQWRRDLPGLDFDSPPLNRLFAGSCGVSLEFD